MKVTATRRLQFCAGHRIVGHESKGRMLHGHNFVIFLTAVAEKLDTCGRVIDFGELKRRIGSWIDEEWDHRFIVWEKDEEARKALDSVDGQGVFLLPTHPTAEGIAQYLLEVVGPRELDGTGVRLVKVTVFETENGIAEATV